MPNVSTSVGACQETGDYVVSNLPISLGTRCTYCWTLRTGLTTDGRLRTHRVFCHHPGCQEYREVRARVLAGPVAHWPERGVCEVSPQEWRIRAAEIQGDWLALPLGDRLLVFVEHLWPGFERDRRSLAEIEQLILTVPSERRIRRAQLVTGEPEKVVTAIAVRPNMDFSLPGAQVEQVEELCRLAGVITYRTGVFKDTLESYEPLTLVQMLALSSLFDERRQAVL